MFRLVTGLPNYALLLTGSYCWLASAYASLAPHPAWLLSSIVALECLAAAMVLALRALSLEDEKTLGSPLRPFVHPVRAKEGPMFLPQIIVLLD